jgi:hypothetical protein
MDEGQDVSFVDRISKNFMMDFKHGVLINQKYVKIWRYTHKMIKIIKQSF